MPDPLNQPGKAAVQSIEVERHPVTVLLELFASQQGELILNLAGQPYMRFPEQLNVIVPVHSLQARWLLAEYSWRNGGHHLDGADIGQLTNIIAGMALRIAPSEPVGPATWEQLAKQPVAQALLAFMEGREWQPFHGTMTQLLSRLTETALVRGIVVDKHWPRIANLLGATLSDLTPLLQAAGVAFTRIRTGQVRRVTITATARSGAADDDDDQSSRPSSPLNIIHEADLAPSDDGDGACQDEIIRRIEACRSEVTESQEE